MLRVRKIDYQIERLDAPPDTGDAFLTRTDRIGAITLWPRLLDTQPPQVTTVPIASAHSHPVPSMLDEVRVQPRRIGPHPSPTRAEVSNFIMGCGLSLTAGLLFLPCAPGVVLGLGVLAGASLATPVKYFQDRHLRGDAAMLGFCDRAERLRRAIVVASMAPTPDAEENVLRLRGSVFDTANTEAMRAYCSELQRFAAERWVAL